MADPPGGGRLADQGTGTAGNLFDDWRTRKSGTSWPTSRTPRRTCTSTRGFWNRGGTTWWWAIRRTSRSRTRSSTRCIGSCTTRARARTRCRCRSPSGSSNWRRQGDAERSRLRHGRPDHRELVHEARVRDEADRGVLRARVELTEVIDTSGAYIPGHGTPTVILVGKRRDRERPIRNHPHSAKRSRRALHSKESGGGLVWNAIVNQIDNPGSVSQWVSVDDLDRVRYFGKQPWILTDGGLEMVEQLNSRSKMKLSAAIEEIGAGAVTREDSAYMIGAGALRRHQVRRGPPTTTNRRDRGSRLPLA